MDVTVDSDGIMHEIVGESGEQTGEGCLIEVATAVGALLMLAAGLGALAWLLV